MAMINKSSAIGIVAQYDSCKQQTPKCIAHYAAVTANHRCNSFFQIADTNLLYNRDKFHQCRRTFGMKLWQSEKWRLCDHFDLHLFDLKVESFVQCSYFLDLDKLLFAKGCKNH